MAVSGTRDATLTLRVWQEPHDPVLRGRLTCLPAEKEVTVVGTDQILAAVAAALDSFESGTE